MKTVLVITTAALVGTIVYFVNDEDVLGAFGFALIVIGCFVDYFARSPIET